MLEILHDLFSYTFIVTLFQISSSVSSSFHKFSHISPHVQKKRRSIYSKDACTRYHFRCSANDRTPYFITQKDRVP